MYLFCSFCLFCILILLNILFLFATRLTVRCYGPIYSIIDVFHKLLMLMFDMLVKSFVVAEVKATMLTLA